MFSEISPKMQERMKFLEEIDNRDRNDGTERLKRLRQIPPETGKFIALLASNCPVGDYVEIGTSAGYSTLWLSLAMREKSRKIKTYEILPEKIAIAKETFKIADVNNYVELYEGDFLLKNESIQNIAFCFLDCEKHLYEKCFDIISDRLVKGGLIVADNAINHYEHLKGMIEKASNDDRFDCLTVPIGKGEFLCRKK